MKVRVGYIGLTCEAPIFTAVEKGFFKEEGLAVELVRCKWATYKAALALGRFDVVIYLGVLYHMVEPLTALQRVRAVTGRVAVIETEGIHVPAYRDDLLLRFFAGDELHHDYGNWYATSERALHGMCRAAGFSRVETKVGPPPPPPPLTGARRIARGVRNRISPPSQAMSRYRLVVHAFV